MACALAPMNKMHMCVYIYTYAYIYVQIYSFLKRNGQDVRFGASRPRHSFSLFLFSPKDTALVHVLYKVGTASTFLETLPASLHCRSTLPRPQMANEQRRRRLPAGTARSSTRARAPGRSLHTHTHTHTHTQTHMYIYVYIFIYVYKISK